MTTKTTLTIRMELPDAINGGMSIQDVHADDLKATTEDGAGVSLVGMHRTTFHDIWFDDREFRETHGRAPRGFGGWAFEFEGLDMVWAPPMKFSAAKVWIRKYIRNLAPYATGTIRVKVCT